MSSPKTGQAQAVASSVDPPAGEPASKQPGDEPIVYPAPQPAREPTAADVAGAPAPGQESGRLDRTGGGDSPPRLIARGFLFLPKLAVQAALAPIRGGIWANERYRLHQRAHDTFFNEPGTIGLYPTVGLMSGYGLTLGARFVHRDLLGAGENLGASAMFGGRFRSAFNTSFRTGDRFGDRLELEAKGEYDRRSRERFYGIGNNDEGPTPTEPLAEPLDPLGEPIAIESRYSQSLLRATAIAHVRVVSDLHVLGSGGLTRLEFGHGEGGVSADEVYQMESLVGWTGTRTAYTELELRWDGRRNVSTWEPRPINTGGWLASVYSGRTHQLDGGVDFWRYGGELQHFLRIGRGPRVIETRLHVDAVSGERDEVPFFEMPELGGSKFLRGYATERFRDRVAAVGSLDYEWDLSQMFSARLFTDVGRVYPSMADLSLDDLRLGYGLGIDMHTKSSFWLRTSVASSIDGGLFLSLGFERLFDIDKHVEKR